MKMDPTAINGVPQGNLDDWWDGEPVYGSQWMTAAEGGFLWVSWYGCSIPPGALPNDTLVTVYAENPGWAIADFGPHPTQFNATVEFWIDCIHLVYSGDFDFERDLGMFYIPDGEDSEFVPHDFWINWRNLTAHGSTDHFSRYILARRVEN
jgi:hypothetical protein